MEFLAPPPTLAPFVRRIKAYDERDTDFVRRRELPTSRAVLLFNFGGELRIEDAAGNRTRASSGSGLYSGPSRQYVVSETDGAQEGVHIELTLPGARLLFGRPLEELGNRLIDPADLLGAEALDLVGRLSEAPSQSHRLALLERAAEERAAEERVAFATKRPLRDLIWAWHRLQASGGRVAIGALAKGLGCSRKHLTLRFRHEFGISPKLLARILRFDRAVRLIGAARVASLADLAAASGYADQAHLSREFRIFAGSAPAAFLRRRLPEEGGVLD
jgi:AraC-like DNA-binding protein